MSKELFIIGASGHGKVVKSIAEALGYKVAFFVDDDASKVEFLGLKVVRSDEVVGNHVSKFAVGIGVAKHREQALTKFLAKKFDAVTLVHPSAVVHSSVKLGRGSVVMAGAILAPDATLGVGCIVNHGSVIDHDCTLGDYVHVCPRAALAGGVRVGSASWIGIGSSVLQNLTIGSNATVGAGACVIRSVQDKETVVGVPAQTISKS